MNMNATVRGTSLEGLNVKTEEVCQQFYGETPFTIVEQPWNGAYAEFDDSGNLLGFRLDIQAQTTQ